MESKTRNTSSSNDSFNGYNAITPLETIVLRNQEIKAKQLDKKRGNHKKQYQVSPTLGLSQSKIIKFNIGNAFMDILNATYTETENGLTTTVYDRCAIACVVKVLQTGDTRAFREMVDFMDTCMADTLVADEVPNTENQPLDKLVHNGGIKNEF